jgi:hypothetical protein
MTTPTYSDVVQKSAIAFVGAAAFPRLVYRLRWPTRLGPRGFVAYAAFNTLLLFAAHTWVIPWAKRMAQARERAEQELREQLGREPTEDEVLAHFGIGRKR